MDYRINYGNGQVSGTMTKARAIKEAAQMLLEYRDDEYVREKRWQR